MLSGKDNSVFGSSLKERVQNSAIPPQASQVHLKSSAAQMKMEPSTEETELLNRKRQLVNKLIKLRSKRHESAEFPREDLTTEADLGWEICKLDEHLLRVFDARTAQYYQERLDTLVAGMTEDFKVLTQKNENEKADICKKFEAEIAAMVKTFETEKAELTNTYSTARQTESTNSGPIIQANSSESVLKDKERRDLVFLLRVEFIAQKLKASALKLQDYMKQSTAQNQSSIKQAVSTEDDLIEFPFDRPQHVPSFSALAVTAPGANRNRDENSGQQDVVAEKRDNESSASKDSQLIDVTEDNTVPWIAEKPDPDLDFGEVTDLLTSLLSQNTIRSRPSSP